MNDVPFSGVLAAPTQTTSAITPRRETLEEAISYMRTVLGPFATELREMCDIASPSNSPSGLKEQAAYLLERLQRAGLVARIIEHERGDAVIGELIGDNPEAQCILILGHHDTVYVDGAATPPRTTIGTKFFGPGVADMKGGLLQAIYALEAMQRTGFRDFSKIIFLSVPDEETEDVWMRPLLKQTCRDNDPFVLVLESARTIGNIVEQRKGVRRFRLVAKGVSAHAGADITSGRNAIVELAHQIGQFTSLTKLPSGMTINVGTIKGGTVANVVPDHAEARIDVRYFEPEDIDVLMQKWQKCMNQQRIADVELSLIPLGEGLPPMTTTPESEQAAGCFAEIVKSLGSTFEGEIRGGSSDGGFVSSLGFSALDGLGAVGHQGHSPEEFIDLSAVPQKTAILAELLIELSTRH